MRHVFTAALAALLLPVAAQPAQGAAPSAPAAPAKAAKAVQPAQPAKPAAAGQVHTDRGVRFELPAGYEFRQTTEREPGEEEDTIFIGKKGPLEVQVEVELGKFSCTGEAMAGKPKAGSLGDKATCEVEVAAPPSLDPAIGARRSTTLLVQFPGRHLSVVVFAPDQAAATRLARQIAATGVEIGPLPASK